MSHAGQPKEEDPQLKFARHLFENQQLLQSKVSDGEIVSDNMESLFADWVNRKKKKPPTKTPAPAPVAKRTNKSSSDSKNSGEGTDYDTEITKIIANTTKVD